MSTKESKRLARKVSGRLQALPKVVDAPWRQRPRVEPPLPLVALRDATIYQDHPAETTARTPIFSKLNFALDSSKATEERWAITSDGASGFRTRFLHVLTGKYTCLPPTGRVWPYLAADKFESLAQGNDREPSRAIRYVGFSNQPAGSGGAGTRGAYLGARYESRRENTDWSLLDYLRGTVGLNLSEEEVREAAKREEDPAFEQVIHDFTLQDLLSLPAGSLSNGQTRRARIAKSLITKPQLLLLDEPFAGLDPSNSHILSNLLRELADRHAPRVVLALPSAEVPDWITHVVRLGPDGDVKDIGDKADVYDVHPFKSDFVPELAPSGRDLNFKYRTKTIEKPKRIELHDLTKGRADRIHDDMPGGRMHAVYPEAKKREIAKIRRPDFCFWDSVDSAVRGASSAELLVDMQGVKVNYGNKCVLGNWTQDTENGRSEQGLHWQVRQGDRWAIFGPNGSGKTTMISLITSDHPQAYSLPIKLFGRSRLPSPGQRGISIFDLQARIGHASPEVHTFFPKHLTLRQVIENAWADGFHSRPLLTHEQDRQVDTILRWFRKELDPSQATEPDLIDKYYYRAKDIRTHVGYTARYLGLRPKPTNRRENQAGGTTVSWLAWLEEEASWADDLNFSKLSLAAQKVALFLRAIIKKPDIVILDEAFSGMDRWTARKCMLFLAHGDQKWLGAPYINVPGVLEKRDTVEGVFKQTSRFSGLEPRQALICISHRREEVPFVADKWLRLPEANEGRPVAFGTIDRETDWWADVWDVKD